MNTNNVDYTIFDDIGIKTANFTATFATNTFTSNGHGLVNGNMVVLTTSGADLPLGLEIATVYYVISATTNTFQLSLTSGTEGPAVDITDNGTGTHTFTMHDIGRNIYTQGFTDIVLAFATDGGGDAAFTVKFVGSNQVDCPDFSAAQSKTNHYDVVQTIDYEDGSAKDGDTGVAVAGADNYFSLEYNTNKLRWVNAVISGWTVGELTLTVSLSNNQ